MPSSRIIANARVAAIVLGLGGALALAGDATLPAPAAVPMSESAAGASVAATTTAPGTTIRTPTPTPTPTTPTPTPTPSPTPSPAPVVSASPAASTGAAVSPTGGTAGKPAEAAGAAPTTGLGGGGASATSDPPASPPGGRLFSTTFGADENPISQGGRWINGGTTGLSWTNVQIAGGMAIGTQTGAHAGTPQQYDDSTAVLAGPWGPNQMAQARVRILAVNTGAYEEVELRLRTTIDPLSITGYEVDISDRPAGGEPYVGVVRWNGPLGSYTVLGPVLPGPGLKNGDLVRATVVGSTIRVYINGSQVFQVNDSTYTNGAPGMGFFLQAPTGTNANYGFSQFWAQDGL